MPDPLVVLDASAALAWVMRERASDVVDKLLPVSVLPVSALTETLYRARERGHGLPPDELHHSLLVMGLRIEPATPADAVRAAELISWSRLDDNDALHRSLSLGDGLCVATAERLALPLIGGDEYWESIPMRTTYRPFR